VQVVLFIQIKMQMNHHTLLENTINMHLHLIPVHQQHSVLNVVQHDRIFQLDFAHHVDKHSINTKSLIVLLVDISF
jgi:hypothetical protein